MNVSKVGKILVLVTMLSPLFSNVAEARWERDSDISAYRLQLKDRIALGQTWGKLTAAETARLKDDLNKLSRVERRSSKRGLSEHEKIAIWNELEKIDRSITRELNDREKTGWHKNWDRNRDGMAFWQKHHKKFDYSAFEKNLRKLTTKTAAGIASGQINRDESAYLNDEEKRLQGILDKAKQAGGMTADDITNFERMIEKFDERIEHSLVPVTSSKWNSGNWHHGWKDKKHPAVSKLTKPPQWAVSKEGGYHDTTGQIEGTIPGNELYRFGGTMKDGRAAPTTPHVNVNTSGHISW